MSQLSKKPIAGSISTNRVFTNFESLVLIGNGQTLTIEDEDGGSTVWPADTPFAIGGPSTLLCSYLKVTCSDASYVFYQ